MNVLTKTLNLQEAHTGKTNGQHPKAVENIYRVQISNRHQRGTNGRIFTASVLKNLSYLPLPGCVTLLEVVQIFSWGSMRVQTKPEVLSSSMLFVLSFAA